jgi:hypothetical protein
MGTTGSHDLPKNSGLVVDHRFRRSRFSQSRNGVYPDRVPLAKGFGVSSNDPEVEIFRRRTRFYLIWAAFFLILAAVSWWIAQSMQGNRRIAVEYFLVVFASIGVAVLAIGLVFAVLSYRSSKKEQS